MITKIKRFLRGKPSTQTPRSDKFTDAEFIYRERFRPCYKEVAETLCQELEFETVLDVGCANGFLLEFLLERSKKIRGIEISSDALKVLPDHLKQLVTIADATEIQADTQYDLVTCIEVAEHIDHSKSERLVHYLTSASLNDVYFTAAYPGQPGHGHINCQPQFYWMTRFRDSGFDVNWDKTRAVIEGLSKIDQAPWLPLNSLVFSRVQ
jgi:trans-aconitate methyltransferase